MWPVVCVWKAFWYYVFHQFNEIPKWKFHQTIFSQLRSSLYDFLLALWQVIAHLFSCGVVWLNFQNFKISCFSFFRSEKDFTDSAGLNSLPDVGSTMEVSWCHFTFSPTWFFTSTHNAKRKSWKKSLKCAINIFFLWAYKALNRFFFSGRKCRKWKLYKKCAIL